VASADLYSPQGRLTAIFGMAAFWREITMMIGDSNMEQYFA
jgi:hypothetical protein